MQMLPLEFVILLVALMFVAKIKQKIQEGIANLPTSRVPARKIIKISKDQKGKARDQDQ